MKVLVTGSFRWSHYEAQFCFGLRAVGAEVVEQRADMFLGPGAKMIAFQELRPATPGAILARAALLAKVENTRPDVVLAWRTPWLLPDTIVRMKALGAKVVLYNNDDPFGPDRGKTHWIAYRNLVPCADKIFAYREANLPEYRSAGAKEVALMRSCFDPRKDKAVMPSPDMQSDVAFAGHYEDDGRIAYLEALAESGLHLQLAGTGWNACSSDAIKRLGPIAPVRDAEYRRFLCSTKVALAFFSTRNRDDYTRRCFEIPAMGVAMAAQRTPAMQSLYREGQECVLFSTPHEAVELCKSLVADDQHRNLVGKLGRRRAFSSGYDVISVARSFLKEVA